MEIRFKNYVLKPEPNANGRFNVYKEKIGQKGKDKGNIHQSIISYAVTVEHALEIIAHDILEDVNEQVDFKEYIDRLKALTLEIKRILWEEKELNH